MREERWALSKDTQVSDTENTRSNFESGGVFLLLLSFLYIGSHVGLFRLWVMPPAFTDLFVFPGREFKQYQIMLINWGLVYVQEDQNVACPGHTPSWGDVTSESLDSLDLELQMLWSHSKICPRLQPSGCSFKLISTSNKLISHTHISQFPFSLETNSCTSQSLS